ncbi:hypothetical protein FCM35_KLT02422 [Carex littledalei]|uniref:Uncharacterized protein n=1 Tax=Carex littledalei TaxID=544730 RepID=A0A833QUC6_9POAL|nr:hypothetical protein FCM35_KLT02422 [Carex littledalei]
MTRTPRYCNFYFTCSIDLAFQKIFKELQSSITWDLNRSDAQRILKEAFTKYKDLPPHILELAVQDILALKKSEQTSKEWVSLCTKFWQEAVTKKRDSMEVLIEIIEKDVALFPFIKNANKDHMLRTLDNVNKYINSATKGEYSKEELIGRCFGPEGPLSMLIPDTNADYIEEKMQIAAKLGSHK